jgi:hypothetical protein
MQNKDLYKNYEIKKQTSKTKTELASELGVKVPKDGYWGDMPSRLCGTIGGAIGGNFVKTAVKSFENNLTKK